MGRAKEAGSGIAVYKNGGYRAFATLQNGKRKTKVFRLRSEAKRWKDEVEAQNVSGKTFAEVYSEWLPIHLSKLTHHNHRRNVRQSIDEYVLPAIGGKAISEVKRAELVAVIKAVADLGKVETASRIGQRIRMIFDYAVDCGDIESHPAAGLSRILPAKTVTPQPSVRLDDAPALLKAIQSYPEPITRLGLLLLAHTFTRTNELLGAQWSEVKGDVLVIPAERMKGRKDQRKPHVVPLSTHVLALLRELSALTGEGTYLLQSHTVKKAPIASNTMLFALYRLGYRGRMTGHGFRALASTILNQHSPFKPDVIERQLAHKESDDVRAAYNRAEYLEERRALMQWYSDYLCALMAAPTKV